MPNPFPDEIPSSESFVEGAKMRVIVNHYERDPKARHACISITVLRANAVASTLRRSMENMGGFIHVHHIKPLYTIGENYVVNPVTDMIPLCPNCHAMVHRGSEVLLVEELKKENEILE
nr:HNH endonuclease [Pectobacterium sp. PL152]